MSETASAPAPSEAPAQATEGAPVEGQAPAPVDPLSEFDALLKKAPLKYKASGKEKSVASIKELLRKAEMADGFQAKQQELSAKEERLRAIEERDARLSKAKNGRERAAILREFHGEAFDEAAEEAILERIQREQALSGLTPSERAAREEAERYKAQLAEYEAEKTQREEKEASEREQAELKQLEEQLAGVALKALQAVKLPASAATDAGRRLAFLMARAEAKGLPLEPEELATKAVAWAGKDFSGYTAGLRGESLLSFLGDSVAREAAKALLARDLAGAPSTQAASPPQVSSGNKPTPKPISPMAHWRKLMGG